MRLRFHRLRSWSSSSTISPSASKRAAARACCSSIRAASPMTSGSAREHAQQQAHQPDASSARARARRRPRRRRRIALVEHQVDHGRHGGEPLGPLGRARRLERHAGVGDARLGAGDALLHRRLAHQEGARDLLDRQAADDAQRQRDLLRGRQLGMAADEQQPQDVVAVVGAVEPLGQLALGVVEVGDRRLVGQRHLLGPPPHVVHARRCGRPRSARRRHRAAGRSAATSSGRAGRPPERLPRRYRDRGNSAAARPSPGGGPSPGPRRSSRGRSRRGLPCSAGEVMQLGDRPDLVAAGAGIGLGQVLGASRCAASSEAQSTM